MPLRNFSAICCRQFHSRAVRTHAQEFMGFVLADRPVRLEADASGSPRLGTRLGALMLPNATHCVAPIHFVDGTSTIEQFLRGFLEVDWDFGSAVFENRQHLV